MAEETDVAEGSTSKPNPISIISAVAAIIAAVAAGYSLVQSERLNSETAFLQHTQHRITTCIAISQHHYAMWERDTAIGWDKEVRLIVDGEETEEDGQPIIMSTNFERANKAIGLARQLALCASSNSEQTRACIRANVEQNPHWLVNDDNVGHGEQPRQGSRNPAC